MIPYYYDANDKSTYRMMNQTGVKQAICEEPTLHNASWDAILGPNGELYFSLCSEQTTAEYAKLAVYDPESNTVRELHYTRDILFPNDRFIRDSKFHTSMAWMNDGRMITVTHTTDKSPEHPYWAPLAHYNDPWTGYPGSSLMCYDPKTGEMQSWGIPVQRETLYGAAYDRINNVYYALGNLKGYLYGIDLNNRSVRNYGQAVEKGSYRLVVGSDDNIYYTTKNGILQRINTQTREIEDLKIQLPYKVEEGRQRPYMSFAVNGSDGKLYIAGMQDEHLSCYDPASGEFRVVGRYSPAEKYVEGFVSKVYMGAMAFDKNDVLYYAVCTTRSSGDGNFYLPTMLMRWDLHNGKVPEVLGFVGTEARMTSVTCSLLMDTDRDRMFIVGTNHAMDAPHITQVDLSVYRDHALEQGPLAKDPFAYPDNTCERYAGITESSKRKREFNLANSTAFSHGQMVPVALWKDFDSADKENSHVADLRWDGDKLIAVCGKTKFTAFTLDAAGNILSQKSCSAPCRETPECDPLLLPNYPGRQCKREADLAVPLSDGRRLIATKDGMLAVEKDSKAFSLGIVWPHGPVNAMTVSKDLKKVYGVAGDKDDVNVVFSYDDEAGVRLHGFVVGFSIQHGQWNSPYLTAIALDESGKHLAIGAGGRMGTVYIYTEE